MGLQVIIYVALVVDAIISAALLFLVDDAWDSLSNWALTKVGWPSGQGPLVVVAERNGDKLALNILNHGRAKIRLAAVEGRDGDNQRRFPTPYIPTNDQKAIPTEKQAFTHFGEIVLDAGDSQIVELRVADLLDSGCSSLAIIDSNGKSWPVQRFSVDELNQPN